MILAVTTDLGGSREGWLISLQSRELGSSKRPSTRTISDVRSLIFLMGVAIGSSGKVSGYFPGDIM